MTITRYTQSRYVVCMDDGSRLSGYSEQTFIGTSIDLDNGVLSIFHEPGRYTNINWSRVRWYTREPIIEEDGPNGGHATFDAGLKP